MRIHNYLAMSVVLVLSACDMMGSMFDPDDLGSSDEPASMSGMVDAHNNTRAHVSPVAKTAIPNLTWSSTIADIAQAYAEECVFEHSGHPNLGENLYAETGQTATAAQVVASWNQEAGYYHVADNTCDPNPYATCGHYTQVVWAETLHVGCGMKRCTKNSPFGNGDPWNSWVCNYDPPGNYVGHRPYETH